mmetsp:Transcript_137754/g.343828  ORF Transcript_137754/g.343828 Transcript_137754/m.343828 type:complete len:706 (+) Transcript_137754:80-2197(+)
MRTSKTSGHIVKKSPTLAAAMARKGTKSSIPTVAGARQSAVTEPRDTRVSSKSVKSVIDLKRRGRGNSAGAAGRARGASANSRHGFRGNSNTRGRVASFHGGSAAGQGRSLSPRGASNSEEPQKAAAEKPASAGKSSSVVFRTEKSASGSFSKAEKSSSGSPSKMQTAPASPHRQTAPPASYQTEDGTTFVDMAKMFVESPSNAQKQRQSAPAGRSSPTAQKMSTLPEVIEVGAGRSALKTGHAPEPALGPKNEFYGTGERMEAEKWRRWKHMVDSKTIGSHYQYVVGVLPSQVAEENPEQKDHDLLLADGLHKRRPEEATHPRSGEPKPASSTAFTDRAARLREGRGAKATLMPNDPMPTEWHDHGDCTCPVCRPSQVHAAGQVSHDVHYNRVPRCAKASHPTKPHWEPGLSHTFNSKTMASAVIHVDEAQPVPADAEKAFTRNLGCRVKSPTPHSPGAGQALMHRSWSEDNLNAAGLYNQEFMGAYMPEARCRRRQVWQGSKGDSPQRSGAALVLEPRPNDPPAPARICASRKAEGEFSVGHSEESERFAMHFNQDNFRFANLRSPRGRSMPPPKFTPDYAGLSSGGPCDQVRGCSNPVTMEGKDHDARGCSLSTMRSQSPKASFRVNPGSDSSSMALLINHDAVDREFAREAAARRHFDRPFADLCQHTADLHGKSFVQNDSIKARLHHHNSKVQHEMAWED